MEHLYLSYIVTYAYTNSICISISKYYLYDLSVASLISLVHLKYIKNMTIIRRQFMRGTDPINSTWVYLMLIKVLLYSVLNTISYINLLKNF